MGSEIAVRENLAPAEIAAQVPDPRAAVAFATECAQALAGVLDSTGMVVGIQGNRYVKVEGWTTLAAMTNHTPRIAWCRKVDAEMGVGDGWEARCEVLDYEGRVVAAAEAMCLRSERRWGRADEYAVRSMAQTRAIAKALRTKLGYIVAMAGYQSTPAEEIPEDGGSDLTPSIGQQRSDEAKRRLEALGEDFKTFMAEFSVSRPSDLKSDAKWAAVEEALRVRETEAQGSLPGTAGKPTARREPDEG